ncbi:kinesin-like protein Klp10A isoform X2 [Anopheles albimanus]|uniref:kinesin-like protein Klp10A isoform X2 n=1 Tax=Anopheles albimanus TaxID=7167 RepID=UPI00163FFEA7|nr:kinesin-like protein Klp10A isoform X2 [Anopheles albimanus]
MLWFKKRLSTLFGGKSSAKREIKKQSVATAAHCQAITSDEAVTAPAAPCPENLSVDPAQGGRVHSAMVSCVHEDTRSVTVEWYERGETKGKEMDLDMLLELNRDRLVAITESQQENKPPAMAENRPQALTESRIPPPPTRVNPVNRNPTQAVIRFQKLMANRQTMVGGDSAVSTVPAPTSQAVPLAGTAATAAAARRPAQAADTQRRQTVTNGNRATEQQPVENRRQSQRGIIGGTTGAQQQHQQQQPSTSQTNGAGSQAVSGSVPRRSSCVVSVGLMEENRARQRDRFKVLREQKNALMNQDGGNPNWEFANMIREFQSTVEFRPLADDQPVDCLPITVCVRKRPLSKKEKARKEIDVICVPNQNTLLVHEPKVKVDLTKYLENQKYGFDYIFDETCSNESVYMYSAKPLVQSVFEGGMATCFAYGQTGSGKTYTMAGTFTGKTGQQNRQNGIYALAAKDFFDLLHSPQYAHHNFVVTASFYEIYSGKVFDLMADKRKLRVLEDGKQKIQLVGLKETKVSTVEEVLAVINAGNSVRTSGQTTANSNSSRSHAIFSLTLWLPNANETWGKFSFIDLAGSERGADTSAMDQRTRSESSDINKSLLALKECIRALHLPVRGRKTHKPFRGSTLTMVLRDSFIGEKSRTCMIAMIAPGMSSCEHTLNTLRYANRVKELVVIDSSANPGGPTPNGEQVNDDEVETDSALVQALNVSMQCMCEIHGNALTRGLNRTLKDNEMSVEVFNHHAAITELQQKEEEVVDNHQRVHEFLERCIQESRELFNIAQTVYCDQLAYAQACKRLFSAIAENASTTNRLLTEFESMLIQEEMTSQAAHTH